MAKRGTRDFASCVDVMLGIAGYIKICYGIAYIATRFLAVPSTNAYAMTAQRNGWHGIV